MEVAKGWKQPTVLPSYDCYALQQLAWQTTSKSAAPILIPSQESTALQLGFRPDQQEGKRACYWKPSQLPRASKVMDLGGETTTAILVNQHNL